MVLLNNLSCHTYKYMLSWKTIELVVRTTRLQPWMSARTTVRSHIIANPECSFLIFYSSTQTCCYINKQALYQFTFALGPMDAGTKTILTPIKLRQRELSSVSNDDGFIQCTLKCCIWIYFPAYYCFISYHTTSVSRGLTLLDNNLLVKHPELNLCRSLSAGSSTAGKNVRNSFCFARLFHPFSFLELTSKNSHNS